MVPDWIKLVAGPILALLPILAWEVQIKPQRMRRNTALILQAEVEINVVWLLGLAEARKGVPGTLPAAPRVTREAFAANVLLLGELPTALLSKTMLFYSRLDTIVAMVEVYHSRSTELVTGVSDARAKWLRESMQAGQQSLGSALEHAITRGLELRLELHRCAADSLFGDVDTIASEAELRTKALLANQARLAARDNPDSSRTS